MLPFFYFSKNFAVALKTSDAITAEVLISSLLVNVLIWANSGTLAGLFLTKVVKKGLWAGEHRALQFCFWRAVKIAFWCTTASITDLIQGLQHTRLHP